MEQFSVQGQKSNGQIVRSYFNSKQEAEKEAKELERLGHKNVKVAPATDSARKAPARLHRALDRVMDARSVRDTYVPTDKTIYEAHLVSPDYPAHKNSPAGERAWAAKQKAYPGLTGEALWAKPMPRDYPKYGSSLGRGKDRIPADCLDLGTLAL